MDAVEIRLLMDMEREQLLMGECLQNNQNFLLVLIGVLRRRVNRDATLRWDLIWMPGAPGRFRKPNR